MRKRKPRRPDRKKQWPTVYFATQNHGKVYLVKKILERHKIQVVHAPLFLPPEPQVDDLQEIARQKAIDAYAKIGAPVIATDAGFYLEAWNGFPGALIGLTLETLGIRGILKLVEGESRACKLRTCLAYYDRHRKTSLFESVLEGTIARDFQGAVPDHA